MKRIFLVFLASCVLLTTACNKKNPSKPDNPSNPDNPNNPSNPVDKTPNANTASELIKDQYVDGLKITNVSLVISGQSSTFVADVVNETGSPVDVLSFNIILKDAEGKEVTTLLGYVGMTIQAGDSSTITSGVDMDLSNVASVDYVRNY